MRSRDCYFDDIRRTLRDFYQQGDQLRVVRHYRAPRKCEMCGGMVSIMNCYDLCNTRSQKVIVCGEKCIVRYLDVVREFGAIPSIIFPLQYQNVAEKFRRLRPKFVFVDREPESESCEEDWDVQDLIGQRANADKFDLEDAFADGMDPDEIDWDAHDYE